MNIILIMLATIAIFLMGLKIGYNLQIKSESKIVPKIEDIKKNIPFTREYEQNKVDKEKAIKLNKIMNNVDNFNGTKEGQVEID